MTFHIVLVEMDEPIELPDCDDLLNLSNAMRSLTEAFRAAAESSGTAGQWGAVRALETACYYIHGAAGWLAKDEGLIS